MSEERGAAGERDEMAKAKKSVSAKGDADNLPAPEAADEEAAGHAHGILREYFESAVVTVIMALFFMTFVAQAATVPSASMENTINVGDHFLINKFIFAPGPHLPFLPQREVRRGDVVVFRYPSDIDTNEEIVQYKTFFIKRVIGMPGETVQVRGAEVLINGRVIPEHRIVAKDKFLGNDKAELKDLVAPPRSEDETYSVFYPPEAISDMAIRDMEPRRSPGMIFGVSEPYQLKDDEYFMMGDNRDNSKDSRFWGPVKRDLIVGRAMFVIWSYDDSKPKDKTFLVGPVINFFKNTRWGRTGTLIK